MRVVVLGGGAVLLAALLGATATASQAPAPAPAAQVAPALPAARLPAAVAATQHRRARGTDAWRLTRPALHGQIEGYALRISVDPGQPVGLRVSTTAPRFRVLAFRFGWYRGGEAHLVWRSGWLPGRQRGAPVFSDYTRRTVVARWHRSATVPTAGWTPGAYLVKLVASTGWQSDVPLILRSPTARGRVALVAPVATWQAYNVWGGYSLYQGANGDRQAWAVSFDRPFQAPGHADLLYGVVPVVVEAERLGIPLAYLTDIDIAAEPGVLDGARAYVSMGHDEYWTPGMRAAVMRARDHGTNLAFLGADTEFWRIRLTRSLTGPDRVVVGYRSDYLQDPMRSRRPGLTTAPFSDPPVPRPEEALTGMRYACFPVDAPYRVVAPRWWGFAGTGAHAGRRFPHLVGVEADRVHPGPATPRTLRVLSSTPYSCNGIPTTSQSVYYTARSGAGVFDAGTLRWTCSMTRRCGPVTLTRATTRFTRTVTANVLRRFAEGPAAR